MQKPNYNSGGLNISLDDLIKLKRLKAMQDKEDMGDDEGETSNGTMFKMDTDPASGFDIDAAIGAVPKGRKKRKGY